MKQFKVTPWYNGIEQDAIIVDENTLREMGGYYASAENAINAILNGRAVVYVREIDGKPADNFFLVGIDPDYIC